MISEKNEGQEILECATRLFLTKGFKSVTMDDLAAIMGMSKKTIYSFYKTKTDLVKASVEYVFEFIENGIDEIREKKLNPITELYTINDFVFDHLKDENSSPEFQLLKYYPKIHSSLNSRKFEAVHDCMTSGIERGKKMGFFRKDIDSEIISRFYFFSLSEIKNPTIFPVDSFKSYDVTKVYLEYHIRGIATPKGIEFLEKQNS